MTKRTVIDTDCLPVRSPFTFTMLTYLLLDRMNVPGWALGAWGTLLGILWIGFISMKWTEKQRHLEGFGEQGAKNGGV